MENLTARRTSNRCWIARIPLGILSSAMPTAMPRKAELTSSALKFRLQATKAQWNTFFRIKDEIHAVLEEILNQSLDEDAVFGIVLQFARTCWDSQVGRLEAAKVKLHPDDIPKVSRSRGDEDCFDYLIPIEISLMSRPEVQTAAEADMARLREALEDKYEEFDFQVDDYLVLLEAFRLVMSKRIELRNHFLTPASAEMDEDEITVSWISAVPCDICQDDSYSEYCGAHVCAKCKKFFKETMKSRENLSLKCYKSQKCVDDFDCVDIKCRRCRFQICNSIGMVSEYYFTETLKGVQLAGGTRVKLKVTNAKMCSICNIQGELHELFGAAICDPCRVFLHDSLANFSFLKYKCSQTRSCPIEDGTTMSKFCSACLFDKLKTMGLVDLYFWKTQHDASGQSKDYEPQHDVIFRDESHCCVCEAKAMPEAWLGLKCCQGCKGFMLASVANLQSESFCCRKGERGFLCSMGVEGIVCNYCWLRRLEIEGVIDRWNICGGQPWSWTEGVPEDEGTNDEVKKTTNGTKNPKKRRRTKK